MVVYEISMRDQLRRYCSSEHYVNMIRKISPGIYVKYGIGYDFL